MLCQSGKQATWNIRHINGRLPANVIFVWDTPRILPLATRNPQRARNMPNVLPAAVFHSLLFTVVHSQLIPPPIANRSTMTVLKCVGPGLYTVTTLPPPTLLPALDNFHLLPLV